MRLHNDLLELRQKEIQITSEILDKLQLMEDKRGYLILGYNSLFEYLVKGLKYSEATAYQRQACVRLAQDVPEIREKIDQGTLTVSALTAAFKHIRKQSPDEKRETLKSLENKSAREVKKIFQEPATPIQIKKTEYQDRVHLRLELSLEQNEKLEKLKALKSHSHDLESLFEELIDNELSAYENTNYNASKSNNPRCISRRLRNAVLKDANYKCQYPGCDATHFLQVDHIVPVSLGGDAAPDNLQVLCSAHNRQKGVSLNQLHQLKIH